MTTTGALPQSRYFTLERLGDGVYAAITMAGRGAWGNAGIVDLGGATLIFDTFLTPAPARDLRAAAETLTGGRVAYVVNSHYHMDHIQGNQVFEGACVIATEKTREIIADRGARLLEQAREHPEYPESFTELIEREQDAAKREDLALTQAEYRAMDAALGELELRLPDITFTERLTLHGAMRRAEVITYGGGHTQSDAFLYLPDARVVFAGDLLSVRSHPSFYGDARDWLRILGQIEALNFEAIAPGHGPIGTRADVARMCEYITNLLDLATRIVEAGGSREQAEQIAVPEAYRAWAAPTVFSESMGMLYDSLTKDGGHG
jgi:glyoxylase-like metal-dependent hydrolase (beta-lactamase superfamily II)